MRPKFSSSQELQTSGRSVLGAGVPPSLGDYFLTFARAAESTHLFWWVILIVLSLRLRKEKLIATVVRFVPV